MKNILVSSALALSAFCVLSSGSAKAQEFFTNAYARPVEMVDGIHVGARFQSGPRIASATVLAAQDCHAGTACGRRQTVR
jgi:hypothetical protein